MTDIQENVKLNRFFRENEYSKFITIFIRTISIVLLLILRLQSNAQLKQRPITEDSNIVVGVVNPEDFLKKENVATSKSIFKIVNKKDSTNIYNTLWGIEDLSGNTILPVVFNKIEQIGNNYIITLGQSSGLYNQNLQPILPIEYNYIEKTTNKDCFIYSKNGITNFGIIDINGTQVIVPIYYSIGVLRVSNSSNSYFRNDNLCFVAKYDGLIRKFAFFNIETRQFLSGFDFLHIDIIDQYFLVTLLNGNQEFLDLNLRKRSESFDFIKEADYYQKKYIVEKNGKQGVINLEGKYVIPRSYDSIYSDKTLLFCKEPNNISIFDMNGIMIKKMKVNTLDFEIKNYFKVGIGNKYGLVNNNFEEIFPIKYDYINLINGKTELSVVVSENEKWGILNLDKTIVLSMEYQDISFFYNYLLLKKNNKYGIYNSKDRTIVQECNCDFLVKKDYNGTVFICVKGKEIKNIKLKLPAFGE